MLSADATPTCILKCNCIIHTCNMYGTEVNESSFEILLLFQQCDLLGRPLHVMLGYRACDWHPFGCRVRPL